MTLRKTSIKAEIGNQVAIVYRDVDQNEYRVRLFIDEKHIVRADYFTDDKDDARHTAWAMVRHQP